jgi:TonB family protein
MKRTRLIVPMYCVMAASLILGLSAQARPYSQAEVNAMFIRATKPTYPYEARRRREEGRGLFRLQVDERGKVTNVTIVKSTGHQTLDEEAVRAFWMWRATREERRQVDIPVNFVRSGRVQSGDNGMGNDGLGVWKSHDR